MPTCIICKSAFFHQGWSAPAEPCDCGLCISKADALEMDPAEITDLQRRVQDGEDVMAPDGFQS